ncbi:MAG: lipoyl(octanoyl) transferase LipB [Candidatus Nanopelagicales bacterium]|nr:lipoyl(octanoyl) transferase LipB [Candidatus Nanopelagicales bacterium]MDZ4250857.1 lipoyl(octanoyl) transferase LipB [Candidatus Nanopelagicales bacterium]MDZ7577850.1 lipoyl(octanoyl) transferase LipB [Candidatus Nanopelagicales bacterium]
MTSAGTAVVETAHYKRPRAPVADGGARARPLDIVELELGSRLIPYPEAWRLQRSIHARVADGSRPDTLLLLEHAPIFTAGTRTRPTDRPVDGSPVIDVDRGGRITWHGPGQLVGYPIVRLPHPLDVVAHVRRMESLLLAVCDSFGVRAGRREGRSGVWTHDAAGRDAKIAAVGVRVARGVTMHGFALNCDCDLTWADRIVPCGIPDAGVTSLTRVLGSAVTARDAAAALTRRLGGQWPVSGPATA